VDADHHGGWTHIFGGKAYLTKTSRPVEKQSFCLPHQQELKAEVQRKLGVDKQQQLESMFVELEAANS